MTSLASCLCLCSDIMSSFVLPAGLPHVAMLRAVSRAGTRLLHKIRSLWGKMAPKVGLILPT